MTTIQDAPVDLVAVDFSHACAELFQARRRQLEKDSRAHRTDVAKCRARIDLVLDFCLELRRACSETDGALSTHCPSSIGTSVG